MARYRELFSLFPRRLKSGKTIWYYQTYDENGNRTTARSTGKLTEREARRHCTDLYKGGKLIPKRHPTLTEWADERSWWIWGSCLYCKSKLARSSPDKPAIAQRYAVDARKTLETHILPFLGQKRLDQISASDCEKMLFSWYDAGYAMKSINNWASICRTMMAEAFRLGMIDDDPWKRVPLFQASSKPRDIPSLDEARTLLNPKTIDTVWNGHTLYYLINLTASLTACRQGELLALRKEDLSIDHLRIDHSWHIRYGAGPTKTRVKAIVPIPNFLYEQIASFAVWDGYIFSFTNGETPATGNRVTEALYNALKVIGIDENERRERNLVFHSWRRFLNTYLRSKNISDAKIQAVTRHASQEMTEHYTNFKIENFSDVIAVQEDLTLQLSIPLK